MQSDTFFSAILVTALAAVGAVAAATVGAPAARSAEQRHAAQAPAIEVRLPMVMVVGKRETRVAAGDVAALPSRLQ